MEDRDRTKREVSSKPVDNGKSPFETEAPSATTASAEECSPGYSGAPLFSVDELPCGYQSLDEDGHLLEVNEAWLIITGYARDEVIGRWFGDFLAPASAERFRSKFSEIKSSGYQSNVELDLVKKNGTIIPAAFQGRIIRYPDGRFKQTRCVVQDLSELKLVEAQLRFVDTWYKLLVENIEQPICAHDLEGNVIFVNAGPAKWLGVTPADMIGKSIRDYLAPKVRHLFDAYLETIQREGCANGTMLVENSSGEKLLLAYRNTVVRGLGGIPIVIGIARDVTESMRKKQELLQAKEDWEQTFDSVPDLVMILDREHNIMKANRATGATLGVEVEELRGRKCYEAVHGSDKPPDFCPHVQAMKDGREHWVEMTEPRLNASYRVSTTPWADSDGTIIKSVHVARDISDQRRYEKALRESEQKFRLIAEMMEDMVWTTDLEFRTSYVSPSIEKLLGFSQEERYRQTLEEMVTPQSLVMIREMLAQEIKKELEGDNDPNRTVTVNSEQYRKDGSTVWLEVTVRGIRDDNGKLIGIHGVSRDITARKRIEDSLRDSEARYREITENSLSGIVIHQDGVAVYVNKRLTDILGYTSEEMIGQNILDAVRRSDHEMVKARLQERVAGNVLPSRYELVLRKKSGEKVWCELLTNVIQYRERPAIMVNILDISERKRYLEELKASRESYRRLFKEAKEQEELYHTLLNCSPDPIVVYDIQGRVRYLNPAHTALFGWTIQEAEGKPLDTLPAWDRQSTVARIQKVLYEGDTSQSLETQRLTKDGHPIDVSVSAGRYLDVEGKPAGMVVVLRDITERKRIEAALKESEARYRQIAEVMFEAVIFHDQGILLEANDQFFEMFGYEPHELLGEYIPDRTVSPDSLPEVLDRIRTEDTGVYEAMGLKKDGTTFPTEIRVRPLYQGGKLIRGVAIRDISERKSLEKQLLQAQKMEAVGTLAGGIAHDFNNLLQAVIGFAEILINRQADGSQDLEDLRKIHTAGKRGADLVRNLLTFSRKVEPKLRPVDLTREVLEVHKLLSRSIPKTIKIVVVAKGRVNKIMADPSQITQVLMNLAVNARDAMHEGGTLTIETENVSLDNSFLAAHPEIKAGPYVLLTVSDTGHGMDERTIERIFDPFFSTKEVGKGTGLGLATVYGIVKQHGGHIDCVSQPNRGAVFKIYLPSVQMEELEKASEGVTEAPRGTETILLVDDEQVLRELARDILTNFGYRVLDASNGKEALTIYQDRASDISLVMLDLNMPEMDGQHCLMEILKLNPRAKVLVVTGFHEHVIKRRVLGLGAAGVVVKPYDVKQLLMLVRETIDSSSS